MNEKELIKIAANIINDNNSMLVELLDKINVPMVVAIMTNESDGIGTIAGTSDQICLLLKVILKTAFDKRDSKLTMSIFKEAEKEMDNIISHT